jgi:alpha-N-arabinofuranosidase
MKPTSTLFYRQMHNNFTYAATMNYKPNAAKDLAGITCLQNENSNYVFGITKKEKDYYLVLQKTSKPRGRDAVVNSELLASTKIDITNPVRLKVSAKGDNYEFSYSTDGTTFENLGGTISGDILSTDVAGGFTGSLIGLYATSGNDIQP